MTNIYIGNLDSTTTEGEIRTLFATYGAVESVVIVTDRDTGMHRGFAFVEMRNEEEARAAIQGLQGSTLGDRVISVNEARSKAERTHEQGLSKRNHRRHRID